MPAPPTCQAVVVGRRSRCQRSCRNRAPWGRGSGSSCSCMQYAWSDAISASAKPHLGRAGASSCGHREPAPGTAWSSMARLMALTAMQKHTTTHPVRNNSWQHLRMHAHACDARPPCAFSDALPVRRRDACNASCGGTLPTIAVASRPGGRRRRRRHPPMHSVGRPAAWACAWACVGVTPFHLGERTVQEEAAQGNTTAGVFEIYARCS